MTSLFTNFAIILGGGECTVPFTSVQGGIGGSLWLIEMSSSPTSTSRRPATCFTTSFAFSSRLTGIPLISILGTNKMIVVVVVVVVVVVSLLTVFDSLRQSPLI